MKAPINLNRLPPQIRREFSALCEELLQLHGDKIVSVFVYGSAAGRDYIHKSSDVNSVFVFSQFDFSMLQSSLKIIAQAGKNKITAPLFLTKQYLESPLDVFPIEFLDMKENHILIYGEDILSSLKIEERHLRLMCEQQIKGKLIRIRQGYLEAGLKKENIKELLVGSLNSLIAVFRNIIRLKNQQPLACRPGQAALEKEKVLRQLCDLFKLDRDVFLSIYRHKTREKKIAREEVEVLMEKYLSALEKLACSLDLL